MVMDGLIETTAQEICDADGHDWPSQFEDTRERYRDMARSALDALKAHPRYELVKLPEPEPDSVRVRFPSSWLDGEVTAVPGSRRVRCYPEDHRLGADEARDLAAALLAAAKAAEVEQ